jgi:hypothetical protein
MNLQIAPALNAYNITPENGIQLIAKAQQRI